MTPDEREWYSKNRAAIHESVCAMLASGRAAIFATQATTRDEGAAMVVEAAASAVQALDRKCGKAVPDLTLTTPGKKTQKTDISLAR